VLNGVKVYQTDDGIMGVDYKTRTSVAECSATQAEVRELWGSFIRARAERSGARRVLIQPLDVSGLGQVFTYERRTVGDEAWEESGFLPC
jgi:hypothetical protein